MGNNSANGTNTSGLNATDAGKRKLFSAWGSDEAAIVIGGGCFLWWLYWGNYFLKKEYQRYLKHAKKVKRPKEVTWMDHVYWVLGAIYHYLHGLYLRINILNQGWRLRIEAVYIKVEDAALDAYKLYSKVRHYIHVHLLSKAGRKKLFKRAVEETLRSRMKELRVSFVLRFDTLPREIAESKEFQTDLATQIAYAAGYQVPLDMFDAAGRPMVLRSDSVELEVERKGWKMTTQDCNVHRQGYVQRQVKSQGLAARRRGAMGSGNCDEDGTTQENPKRKYKWGIASAMVPFMFGKRLGKIIDEREANLDLGDEADAKKEARFKQISSKLARITGTGLQMRKLKAEADAEAQAEEEKKKAGRICVGVKVTLPEPNSAYLFDKWMRGEDDELPQQKMFEMVYTNTYIPDYGPIEIEFGEKLRLRVDMDDDAEEEKEASEQITAHIQRIQREKSRRAGGNQRLSTFTLCWRGIISMLPSCKCFRKKRTLKRVTRRELATASERAIKTEKQKRMLAHYGSPFLRVLQRSRFNRSRFRVFLDNLYNALHPEFNGIFEESFYNSFLKIHVAPGGQAQGTYGKNDQCKLVGTVGMAEEPGGRCPLFSGHFEEGQFKGDVRISMNEDGTGFEGTWFNEDGKPSGAWYGTRRRTLTEQFLRALKFHWFMPRRVAPASWIEQTAASKMQSAFRGHLARVDIGLVSKQLQAEQLESMAASGDMLPGASKGWGKAKRTLTTAALAGQLKSMDSAAVSGTSSTNFGELFAAKRAQLRGEADGGEVRLEDLMTESEMLAAKALADDHLAMLADDNIRKKAAQAASNVSGGIRSFFGFGSKKQIAPPTAAELDMIVVPEEEGKLREHRDSVASIGSQAPNMMLDDYGTGWGGKTPRSSVAGRDPRSSVGTRVPRSSVGGLPLRDPRMSIQEGPDEGDSNPSSQSSTRPVNPGASEGSAVVNQVESKASVAPAVSAGPVLTKVDSTSAEAIRAIAGDGYTEEDSVGDEMPVWLAYLRLKHYLHIFMIVYEVINLWSFVFADPIPWPSRFARHVFRYATGDIRGEAFPAFFFLQWSVYMFLFIFWAIDVVLVPPKIEAMLAAELKEVLQSADSLTEMYHAIDWKTIPAVLFELFTGIKRLLMEGFYMPTMVSCFNMLHCRYPGTGKPYLAVYPEKQCWTDDHIVEAIMAGTLVFAIYVATMYISCSVKPYHATLYRWDPLFEGRFLMSKALSCGLATLGVNVFGGRLQIYVLTINLAQLWFTQWTQQPCRGRAAAVNNLRTASFAMQFVGAVCALALIEGPGHWILYRESVGFFYCLAAFPVFLTAWHVNDSREEGYELPQVDIVELLKMEIDERGCLVREKRKNQAPEKKQTRRSQVAPIVEYKMGGDKLAQVQALLKGGAEEGTDVEALVPTDHLACSPGRMGIRTKLVAAVSLTYLMIEDQNLQAVKEGVRFVLRMCAEDAEFHRVAKTLLAQYFGKYAPKEYKHNVLLKGAKLTLPEAQIVVGELKRAVGLETIVIRAVYPLARIRRNTLKSFDLQATSMEGAITLADALVLKELMRPVAKLTVLRYIAVSGVLPLPVGDILNGDIEEFSSKGKPVTSGDLLILSEYIRINHSLRTLDFSGGHIGPEGIEALASALRQQRTIETIDLSGNTVCLAANAGSLEAEGPLKTFTLLGNALLENKSLQTLKTHKVLLPVSMLRARKNAPRIKLVDFSNTSRGVLPRDPNESLYDTDIAIIARLLRGAPIDALDLSGNCITDGGANHLFKVLLDPIGALLEMNQVQLRDLDMSSNSIASRGCLELGKALRRNGHLRRLNVSDNKINVNGAMYIARALSATKDGEKTARDKRGRSTYRSVLETLILSDNPLGAKGVKFISKHLGEGGEHEPGKLVHLDLSGTQAHTEGGVALGGMLKHNKHLRVLELRGAKLSELENGDDNSDDALKAIGEGLAYNSTLETLVLEDNAVPSRGCHMLSEGLFHNRTLVTLDVSHNRIGMNVQAMNEIFHHILGENTVLKHFIIAGNPVGPGVLSAAKQWEQAQEQRRIAQDEAKREMQAAGVAGGGRPFGSMMVNSAGAMNSVAGYGASLFPADASLGSFTLPALPSMAPGAGMPSQPAGYPGFNAAMAMPGSMAPNPMAPVASIQGPYTAPGLNAAGAAPARTDSLQGVVPSTFQPGGGI